MNNDDLFGDSDTDHAGELNAFLHALLRSGERVFGSLSNMLHMQERKPDVPVVYPDTSNLKESDVSQAIRLNSGALNDRPVNSPSSVVPLPCMLRAREIGMNGRYRFSLGDQSQITRRVLPNKKDVLDVYEGKVFCGTFAKDGDIFMSASQDSYIRLYDSSRPYFKQTREIEAREVGWSVLDVAISPDGKNIIYCSWSECIHIFRVDDCDDHEALPLYPDDRRFCVFALRFSQDGHEILAGANDNSLYVFDRELGRRTLKIKSHSEDVNTVAFADSTSQILFSGGDDGLCKVWDRRDLREDSPKPVGILAGHEDGITYIDPKGDGRHLITNCKDQSIKLWDMRVFSPHHLVEKLYSHIKSEDIWDYRWQKIPLQHRHKHKTEGDTSLMTYRGHSVVQTLIRCHFSPEFTTGQSYIYTGCANGRVVVYEALTGHIKATLQGHTGCVRDVSWHPYRNEILSSSWDGTVAKWTFSKTEIDSDSDEEKEPNRKTGDDSTNKIMMPVRRSHRLASFRRS